MTATIETSAGVNRGLPHERSARGPIRVFRRIMLGCAVVCMMGIAQAAFATSFTTDQSDLWFIPAESGWGIQVVQRESTLFSTLYVYDVNSKPTWYVATMAYQGNLSWSGDLVATTGPWFGKGTFDPATVTVRRVGTMTWTSLAVDSATVSYDIDGMGVFKSVVRQPIAEENYSGHYAGATHLTSSGCANPVNNTFAEDLGVMWVTQTGENFSLVTHPISGGTCTYIGTITPTGQMGAIAGSYSCNSGETGTYSMFEMQINITGFTARLTSQSPSLAGCKAAGWLGGVKVTSF